MRDKKKVGKKAKKRTKIKKMICIKLYIFILIIKHKVINGCDIKN
jgi:hypothetical protein